MDEAGEPFDVLIPERGRPDLLAATLAALKIALAAVQTPNTVQVLVNGSRRADYAMLQAAHADVHWHFVRRALGFHGAIRQLLLHCQAPWVYLLNSDMCLAPDALVAALPWRAPDVFAVASQIEFADPHRRREETGYTVPVTGPDGHLQLHDLLPPDQSVRGHLYAGGGATLFQSAALRRYLPLSRAYAPFYFEDADWAMQAWAEGLSCLYCSNSRAIHVHRGTIGRYVAARTVERIVQRNLAHFRWRYGDLFQTPRWHGGKRDRLQAGLRGLNASHRQARRRVVDSLAADCLQHLHLQRYPHARRWREGLPRVLLVSPFAVLPVAHGGARRIAELARASADQIDWILLHDEAGADAVAATADDPLFRQIHPVGGRPHADQSLGARWTAHAHTRMRAELARLIASCQPHVICFEHIESIGLIESLQTSIPLLWTLHDAGRDLPPSAQARVRAAMTRVRTLILTTPQDLGFWEHPGEYLVENGVRLQDSAASPSADDAELLLLAPLRYAPNRSGLEAFLEQAWPLLRARHPDLRLRVLTGAEGQQHWAARGVAEGVTLQDGVFDPAPRYQQCLLALNPQGAIEGSALKIAEALAHGRMMISTESGARGFESLQTPALVRVADLPSMANAISALIADPDRRRQIEAQAPQAIAPWSWQPRGEHLVQAIRDLLSP